MTTPTAEKQRLVSPCGGGVRARSLAGSAEQADIVVMKMARDWEPAAMLRIQFAHVMARAQLTGFSGMSCRRAFTLIDSSDQTRDLS